MREHLLAANRKIWFLTWTVLIFFLCLFFRFRCKRWNVGLGSEPPARLWQCSLVADSLYQMSVTWSSLPSAPQCFLTANWGEEVSWWQLGLTLLFSFHCQKVLSAAALKVCLAIKAGDLETASLPAVKAETLLCRSQGSLVTTAAAVLEAILYRVCTCTQAMPPLP